MGIQGGGLGFSGLFPSVGVEFDTNKNTLKISVMITLQWFVMESQSVSKEMQERSS